MRGRRLVPRNPVVIKQRSLMLKPVIIIKKIERPRRAQIMRHWGPSK